MSDSARKPGSDGTRVIAPSATAEAVPPPIPDHELVRCIGRGSYGDVWLARNIMGTWRAVKVVYRQNFENERPYEREFNGIKKFEPVSRSHVSQVDILHVGRNEALGYFYYVMELADDANATASPEGATPIDPQAYEPHTLKTELARRGRLPFEQCVGIGLSLSTALEHLHKHGLIHRDIKPGNIIFVNGIPKLADIGLVTETGEAQTFVGTEGYLPPEGPGTVRADLYSLGKVLYEMATGRDRMEYPELPTLLGQMSDREELLELNEVIIKACANDSKDRYPAAAAMHADLLLLQTGKSVKHTRGLEQRLALMTKVGAAVAVLSILAAGAFIYRDRQAKRAEEHLRQTELLRQQAERERERADNEAAIAKAVNEFLQRDLLKQASSATQAEESLVPDPNLTVRQALDRASERIGDRFKDQPLVEASIRHTLADTYHSLGEFGEMKRHAARAFELRQQFLGIEKNPTLDVMRVLADALHHTGPLSEAIAFGEQTVELHKRVHGSDHPDTIVSVNNLALTYQDAGRLTETIAFFEEALKWSRAKRGPDHPETLVSMNNLARAFHAAGRLRDAISLFEETVKLRKAKLGSDHPNTLGSMGNLASAYLEAGRFADAIPLVEETLGRARTNLGPDHFETLVNMSYLALAYSLTGRLEEAISLQEDVTRRMKSKLGAGHPEVLKNVNNLALAYRKSGRLAEAIPLLEDTLELRRNTIGVDHPETLRSMNNLALAYQQAGRQAEATPLHEETMRLRNAKLGPDHPDTLMSMHNLALAYKREGRLAEAIALHEEALKRMETKLGPAHPTTLTAQDSLALEYQAQGRSVDAERLLRDGLKIARKQSGSGQVPASPQLGEYLHHLADVLRQQKRLPEAHSAATEAIELYKRHPGWPVSEVRHAWRVFTDVLQAEGDLVGAERSRREAAAFGPKARTQ